MQFLASILIWPPPWWLVLPLANVAIIYTEYRNRAGETWLATLPYTIVPIIFAQWALYHGWRHAPKLLMAWAVFTVGNSIMRVVVASQMNGESFDFRTPLGVLVMIAGSFLVKEGLSK